MNKRTRVPAPNANQHRPEREYVVELLARAKHTQRGAAVVLGISERTMRYYCSGEQPIPYSVQYALEMLAWVREHEAGTRSV